MPDSTRGRVVEAVVPAGAAAGAAASEVAAVAVVSGTDSIIRSFHYFFGGLITRTV